MLTYIWQFSSAEYVALLAVKHYQIINVMKSEHNTKIKARNKTKTNGV